MDREIHLRRSVLYAPGVNRRALNKARGLPIDCLIMDLEDAVAPDAKSEARESVVETLAAGGFGGRETAVRINGLDTPWGAEDIAAMACAGADAIVIPKVESAAAVEAVVEALACAGAPAELPLWIMAETPRGVLDLDAICRSQPRIGVVVMGTSDLAKSMRLPHTPGREGLMTALGHCLLVARAHGLDILDGVFLDLQDSTGFHQACQQGRAWGCDGKTLIHPNQIAVANEIFGVSATALAQAQKIVVAWERVESEGGGLAVVDGRLVERLHVDEAERLLALAEAIG
ncbi:MAG: CoA ester lyase [Sedimenticola sp.]